MSIENGLKEIEQDAFAQRETVKAMYRMIKVHKKVGLVSLSEKPLDVGDVSI